MKAVAIGFGVFFAVILLVLGAVASNYITYSNQAVGYEARLDAQWNSSKNTLSTYTTKVQEVAQVPGMYRDDLMKVIDATFQGRYGQDGSKAVVSFIKESNLNLDAGMYRHIQQVMESGRNDFKASQDALIDTKRGYVTQLNKVWSGFWMKLAGYPKVDLDKYKVVVVEGIDQKFQTGKDEVIKLR